MKRKHLFLALWLGIACYFGNVSSTYAAEQSIVVEWSSNPPFSQLGPDRDQGKFQLKVTDDKGNPVSHAKVNYILHSPETSYISTDFPHVEGTSLLKGSTTAENGVVEFAYVPPIRGTYKLDVKVEATEKSKVPFAPFEKQLSFTIAENADEVRNGVLLMTALAIIGLWFGYRFSKIHRREAV